MSAMRSFRPLGFLFCILLVSLVVLGADNLAAAQQTSNVHFTVVKDDNNKPVRNASVILHPVEKDGKQSKGGFQLKTDSEGKAGSDGLPYGRLRVQVIAHDMQTFGDDYDLNKPDMEIEIRLKRPTEQLSVYGKPTTKPKAAPPAESRPQ
jgi:hypothetical protein